MDLSGYLPEWYEAESSAFGEVTYTKYAWPNLNPRHARLGMNPSYTETVIDSDITQFGQVDFDYGIDEGITPEYNVNDFTLNMDRLGDSTFQTHKLVVAGKGKAYSLILEQETNESFGILDIGMLYKLGKVKEDVVSYRDEAYKTVDTGNYHRVRFVHYLNGLIVVKVLNVEKWNTN